MQYLKEFGFSPQESIRLNRLTRGEAILELERNLQFFTEHALDDRPVSSPYYYWFGPDNKLYSHPSRRPEYLVENQIDPKERGGTTLQGFQKLTQALSTPDSVVIHYSPKGKASFSDMPGESFEVDSYKDGQLTFQYFDGEMVQAVGLMTNNENLVFSLLDHFGLPGHNYDLEEGEIAYYLLQPLPTYLTLDEFMKELDSLRCGNATFYTDKNNSTYSFGKILELVHQSFQGKLPQLSRIHLDKTVRALERDLTQSRWTREKVQETYLRVILNYARLHGLNEVKLMASCGGKVKSTKDIVDLLYESGLSKHLSTDFLNPNNVVSLYSSDTRQVEPFVCPKCGYETTKPVGNQCPSCKITKERAVKEGYVTC